MRAAKSILGQILVAVSVFTPRAEWAAEPSRSRGRRFPESPSAVRSDFRRDCDRIIHSTAFRRLKHKTQVFVSHEGDHFRTRLTHTLEVSQIARALARALGLDEDLAEALALSHDLGHPPFGHAGERALQACLENYGGFDHNAQSLRVVTKLERRYASFDGLNLTWETLEGIAKHNGPLTDEQGSAIGRYEDDGLPLAFAEQRDEWELEYWTFASAEAQVAAISDDIAYDAHEGRLTLLEVVPTLPSDFNGANKTAEVIVHPRGHVVYGSNRGHDSLVVFARDPATGLLTWRQTVPSGGRSPRHFDLSPDGRWLVALHEESNDGYVFRVDPATGQLERTNHHFQVPQPVCVLFGQ